MPEGNFSVQSSFSSVYCIPVLFAQSHLHRICLMQGPEGLVLTNKQLFAFLFLLDCSMCFLKSQLLITIKSCIKLALGSLLVAFFLQCPELVIFVSQNQFLLYKVIEQYTTCSVFKPLINSNYLCLHTNFLPQ